MLFIALLDCNIDVTPIINNGISDKGFEKELPAEKFIRVHKSYIINLERVERFNSKFVEIGKDKVPLSRNKKEEIVKAIENT